MADVENLFQMVCRDQVLTDDRQLLQDQIQLKDEEIAANKAQIQSIVDKMRDKTVGEAKGGPARKHNPMEDCVFNEILPHHQHRHGTLTCSKATHANVCTLFEHRQNIIPKGWKRPRMEEILMKK